jgi:curved DNA-binding protein CbpA
MRWPTRTGTEVMRTVAARVNLTPSHYAMLGVPRDFTEAQLRKQYRLLAMRYHPDAADRNGIDPQEALERFTALQTAYSVLSDPERRRRYDMQERLQHRREWRRAWDGPTLLLMDKSGGGGVQIRRRQRRLGGPREGDVQRSRCKEALQRSSFLLSRSIFLVLFCLQQHLHKHIKGTS